MESPQDFSANRNQRDRVFSRRSLLGWSAAGTFCAAAGLVTARVASRANTPGGRVLSGSSRVLSGSSSRVLFDDAFSGKTLSQERWNPYICDNTSHGKPWLMQPRIAVPSSAIGLEHGRNLAYALPAAIDVHDGLTLSAYRGTKATGYSWTGSVICSRPTSNNFGSGTVHTAGFTFADALVEVRAKMPDLTGGQWPAIWFLPAENSDGGEIDLFEGGFLAKGVSPNRTMAVKLFTNGNAQRLVNCHTDLSAGFHTYAMEYRQGSSIKIFLDGLNVCTFTHNVPVGRYFIILSNSIASAETVGWHTQVGKSTPAVNRMQVSFVRVTAL
jgi:hypothetical protein